MELHRYRDTDFYEMFTLFVYFIYRRDRPSLSSTTNDPAVLHAEHSAVAAAGVGGEPKVIDAEVHTGPYHVGSAD
jgi:hypothetical protein